MAIAKLLESCNCKSFNRCDVFFIFLKVMAMLSEIVCETVVFKKQVIDGVPTVENILAARKANQTTTTMFPQYIRAAWAYSIFYILGILYTTAYWVIYVNARKKDGLPFLGTLVLIFCNMPSMVCEMIMLKSRGVINLEDNTVDIVLQIVFCVNAIIHIYMDLFVENEIKGGFSYIILLAISFLSMCCIYAPVMWAMVGWKWIGVINVNQLPGLDITVNACKALDVFMLLGHIGQFVLVAVIIMAIYSYVSCRRQKPPSQKSASNLIAMVSPT